MHNRFASVCKVHSGPDKGGVMQEVQRISPEAVRPSVRSGDTLLVCAYEDEEKCRKMQLEGAITFNELRSRISSLPKEQEIVFYCA